MSHYKEGIGAFWLHNPLPEVTNGVVCNELSVEKKRIDDLEERIIYLEGLIICMSIDLKNVRDKLVNKE